MRDTVVGHRGVLDNPPMNYNQGWSYLAFNIIADWVYLDVSSMPSRIFNHRDLKTEKI